MKATTCLFCLAQSEKLFFGADSSNHAVCPDCIKKMYKALLAEPQQMDRAGDISHSLLCSTCILSIESELAESGSCTHLCKDCLHKVLPAALPLRGSGASNLLSGQTFRAKILAHRDKGYSIEIADTNRVGILLTEMVFLIGATVNVIYVRIEMGEYLFAIDFSSMR